MPQSAAVVARSSASKPRFHDDIARLPSEPIRRGLESPCAQDAGSLPSTRLLGWAWELSLQAGFQKCNIYKVYLRCGRAVAAGMRTSHQRPVGHGPGHLPAVAPHPKCPCLRHRGEKKREKRLGGTARFYPCSSSRIVEILPPLPSPAALDAGSMPAIGLADRSPRNGQTSAITSSADIFAGSSTRITTCWPAASAATPGAPRARSAFDPSTKRSAAIITAGSPRPTWNAALPFARQPGPCRRMSRWSISILSRMRLRRMALR